MPPTPSSAGELSNRSGEGVEEELTPDTISDRRSVSVDDESMRINNPLQRMQKRQSMTALRPRLVKSISNLRQKVQKLQMRGRSV